MADHANRGVEWERILDARHDAYRRDGLAVVFRTPPSVRLLSRVGRDGQFRGCFRGQGPPDYAGVVAGGRAVAFDAKDCAGERWSFGALERHQARDLEGWSGAGGIAFVALRLAGEPWVLPWARLGPIWWAWHEREGRAARGSGSLTGAMCAELGRRMPEPGDWLAVGG